MEFYDRVLRVAVVHPESCVARGFDPAALCSAVADPFHPVGQYWLGRRSRVNCQSTRPVVLQYQCCRFHGQERESVSLSCNALRLAKGQGVFQIRKMTLVHIFVLKRP